MVETRDRKIVLQPHETIFARICLEHGWATRAQIAACLQQVSPDRPPADASLPALLVARNIITAEQAEIARAEVAEITRVGTYADVRKGDSSIGQLLVDAGAATAAQVQEALTIQKSRAAGKGKVPRLGEILIEKGYVTLVQLQDALRRQEQMTEFRCASCGSRYSAEDSDGQKTYLCRKCAMPLSYTGEFKVVTEDEIPEEVRRCATNPKNVVGKYVAVQRLGVGAMGAVYKAWDTEIRRWVAFKTVREINDQELLLRFRQEAETAAALQHPHIVPIYDVGEEAGRPFIAMKYIQGETLVGKKFPAPRACEIIAQAAAAVGHAHQRDIVHRDLKPANLMLDESGRVYVMDFGLAKNLFGSSRMMTAPGTVMGTPGYMAPEQAAGRVNQVNQRSDVYSLGAILYELLTGRVPFKGERPVQTIHQILNDPVTPPTKYQPDIPADLEKIVLRALEKEKANRYSDATELADILRRHLKGLPTEKSIPAAPAAPAGSKAGVWFAAAALLGALAAAWAFFHK